MSNVNLAPLRAAVTDLAARADEGETADWSDYAVFVPPRQLQDGSLTFPYCNYRPAMDRLWSAFAAAGFEAHPADYRTWLDAHRDPYASDAIGGYLMPDLNMVLLAMMRGERFNEGLWTSLLRSGVFLAVGQRWLALAAPDADARERDN